MTAVAEMTTESVIEVTPNCGRKFVFVQGTSTENSDWITVTDLSAVEGAVLTATDGTIATMTFATNKITITNGSTKVWSGIAWGY
jgi:hypothetical protein